ncbi:MAG: hypothetical protein GY769_07745 [bacterium]|nr:hypothetical protein [bacterium]
MNENEKREAERRRIRELEQRAEEHNARIIPETPGYVRTEGPRRQTRASVRNGMLHYEEI